MYSTFFICDRQSILHPLNGNEGGYALYMTKPLFLLFSSQNLLLYSMELELCDRYESMLFLLYSGYENGILSNIQLIYISVLT